MMSSQLTYSFCCSPRHSAISADEITGHTSSSAVTFVPAIPSSGHNSTKLSREVKCLRLLGGTHGGRGRCCTSSDGPAWNLNELFNSTAPNDMVATVEGSKGETAAPPFQDDLPTTYQHVEGKRLIDIRNLQKCIAYACVCRDCAAEGPILCRFLQFVKMEQECVDNEQSSAVFECKSTG